MPDGYDLSEARRRLPILREWTYLNTGTVGIMAEPVLALHLEYVADHERGGHATQARAVEGYERSRKAIAELVGVEPREIALNRNATDGVNFVAASFPLRPGDEVLTSTEEHPAIVLPWSAACERSGATLRFFDLSHDKHILAERIRGRVSSRTRIVALSQVSCETGARIPVECVRDVIGPDIALLVDAAQSVGQFPVSIPSMRADFVIGNGHKWLAGPKGTGFAWFNPHPAVQLLPPAYIGDGSVEPRWTRPYYQSEEPHPVRYAGDATRYEYGTRAWHTYGALADAIDYQAAFGWSSIFDHVQQVTDYAKRALASLPGVKVITPTRWSDSSGLVTFTTEGWDGTELSRRLWDDHRITQRRVESPSAVRISCAYFTDTGDIDRLVEAIEAVTRP